MNFHSYTLAHTVKASREGKMMISVLARQSIYLCEPPKQTQNRFSTESTTFTDEDSEMWLAAPENLVEWIFELRLFLHTVFFLIKVCVKIKLHIDFCMVHGAFKAKYLPTLNAQWCFPTTITSLRVDHQNILYVLQVWEVPLCHI